MSIGRRLSPLGATMAEGGTNFSLVSRTASGVELLFFDDESDARPSRVIRVDPAANRTYYYWHVFVPGVRAGQIYGYRVRGVHQIPAPVVCGSIRTRCCSTRMARLWSRAARLQSRLRRRIPGDNAAMAVKNVIVDPSAYDWEGDTLLAIRLPGRLFTKCTSRGLRAIRARASPGR